MLPRLQRLLAPDGNCFDVAIDHGVLNDPTDDTLEQALALLREVA